MELLQRDGKSGQEWLSCHTPHPYQESSKFQHGEPKSLWEGILWISNLGPEQAHDSGSPSPRAELPLSQGPSPDSACWAAPPDHNLQHIDPPASLYRPARRRGYQCLTGGLPESIFQIFTSFISAVLFSEAFAKGLLKLGIKAYIQR